MCLESVLHNKRGHRNEKPMHHMKSSSCLPLEKARTKTKTQHGQKSERIRVESIGLILADLQHEQRHLRHASHM